MLAVDDGVLVEGLTFGGYTWPEFTPDGTDYAVECTGSTTAVDIELLRSATARINGVPVASGTIDLGTAPDDRIRVELRRGSDVQNLSFRCMPDGFPRLDIDRPRLPLRRAGTSPRSARRGAPAGMPSSSTTGVPRSGTSTSRPTSRTSSGAATVGC